MKLPTIHVTFAVSLITCISSIATAQPVYFPTTDSWYEIVHAQNNWSTVNAAATSYLGRPGRLATINSQAENDFVVNSLMLPTGQGCWLGATRSSIVPNDPPGDWRWITGEPWSFTNWAAGEPNNASGLEEYLEIYTLELGGKWNDLADGQTQYTSGYIIEYAPVPEPGTFALFGLGALILWRRR